MIKELATSVIIIAFCGFLIPQALKLPPARFEPLGPSFFPLVVLTAIIALSVLHMAVTVWKGRRAGLVETEEQSEGPGLLSYAGLMPAICVLAFAAYSLLISYTDIPFLVLTFFFVGLMSWMMSGFRTRAIPFAGLVAAVLVALQQFVFVGALSLVLP